MLVYRRKLHYFLAVVVLIVSLLPLASAQAIINDCSVSITPNTVTPGSNINFTVSVRNNSASDIVWLDFTLHSNFGYNGNSISGWTVADHPDGSGTTAQNGVINQGQTLDFSISANSSIANASAANWQIRASDDPGGADPHTCTGSAGVSIAGHPPNDSDNGVAGVVVSNPAPNSATISWDSDDVSTSIIYYGTSSDYGSSSAHNKSLVSQHVVNISSLTPDTVYHFQVAGQGTALYPYYSGDYTFITPPSQTIDSGGNQPVTTKIPIKAVPTEKVPPIIKLKTDFSKPQKTIPTINGFAEDNEALAGIEYSTDGGKNWLPVDKAPGLGGKKSDFSFTPQNLKDGNYTVIARAIDASGNTAQTTTQMLIIDLLPPLVGGNVVYVASQNLLPDEQGTIKALAGIDQKITLSAVGGPTAITIGATEPGKDKIVQGFSLVYSSDTGLWSGILSFKKAGTYQLVARAVDGAGNTTRRALNTVEVSNSGKITDSKNKVISATVQVFYRDVETSQWVLWDGAAYGQDNSKTVDSDGAYGFYLPIGTYYLRFNARDYRSVVTRSFTLDKPTAIATNITMHTKPGFNLGSLHIRLPWFNLSQAPLTLTASSSTPKGITKLPELPGFSLSSTDGKVVMTKDLYGKPTVISFMNTWATTSSEQLATFSSLDVSSLNVIPVMSGESLAKLTSYKTVGNYTIPILADSNNQLIQHFDNVSLPVHYFLDRHGVVKRVKVGVLSNQEVLENVEL